MSRHVLAVATVLLLVVGGQAQAETLPSFHLSFSAWKASDVVVIDLNRRVLETWKGNLKVGDELPTTVVIRADVGTRFALLNRVIKACQDRGFRKFALKAMNRASEA